MRFVIRTHGCRANQYDTEAVRGMLLASGADEVANPSDADVAIFNSCTVTASAEAGLRKEVRRTARLNPAIRTMVIGCAPGMPARDESRAPLRTLPTVFHASPGADLDSIGSALGIQRLPEMHGAQTGARALLRIQDGCDEHCTFCATTIARGASKSRPSDDLVAEATVLAGSHPEIVLTGIHIGSYGLDIGSSLSRLVERLIDQVPSVRFRLSSVEATEVDDRLLDLFAERSRFAPYLHAPLQSGSNSVLKRMGRHWYTAASYSARIGQLANRYGIFGLGADIICGFPGETERDHRDTMDLIERLPFTSLHVFPYSARPGTASIRLKDLVTPSTVEGRCAEMRELGALKAASHRSSRAGGRADVVAVAPGEGLTEDYLSVTIPDPAIRRRDRFDAVLAAGEGRLIASPIQTFAA